jgi:ankyrin repeat protein
MATSEERSLAIRKAVEQAKLELQHASSSPSPLSETTTMNIQKTKSELTQNGHQDLDIKKASSTTTTKDEKNSNQHYEKLETLSKMSSMSSFSSASSPSKIHSPYLAFTIQNATYNTSHQTETSIRSDSSWDEITEAIAKKLPLFSATSITHLFLVDAAGDILSPPITSAVKFFKIFPHYEPGMVFLVHVNGEIEDQFAKLLAEEEFKSRALHLTFQNSFTKMKNKIYIEVGASWETILESISKEMQETEPHYVSYIVVEDADGDEISPPLNSTDKFWRFAGPNSVENGDLFIVKINEEVVEKEKKEMEHEIYIANCRKILVKLVASPELNSVLSVPLKAAAEVVPVYIPKNCGWVKILDILTETYSNIILSPDWIDSLLLIDSEGDDLSPPIDSELIFWKVMNTYDLDSGGIFLLHFNEKEIEEYKMQKKEEEFRATAKHFKVTLECSKKIPPVDIYVPHECSWQVLTEGVASFLGLSDASWIDHFILLDSEHEPLSPQLNTASKFWKLGQKLAATDNMAIHVILTPEALKLHDEQYFLATATSFPLRLSTDQSIHGTGYATPGSRWEDLTQRIAEALGLESSEWVSHVVLVDQDDDDVLSPPIKSEDKFWRFVNKISPTSYFLVYQNEERVAQSIAEKLRKQAWERKLEEEIAAKAKVFHCVLRDSHGQGQGSTSERKQFRLQANCSWDEIRQAISATGLIEAEFIDHLQLFDSSGVALSVPITNAKLFWKFASNVEGKGNASASSSSTAVAAASASSAAALFVIFVNHSYRSISLKKHADDARKRSMCLLHVSLSKEEKPVEILIGNNSSWEQILTTIASNIETRPLLPEYIHHLLLFDNDGDQLSPMIETSDQFWSIWPLYRVEESMVFVVMINEEKVNQDAQLHAQEEFYKTAKRFKFYLHHEVSHGLKSIYLSPSAVWHDLLTLLMEEYSLDDISWIDYLLLKDNEGDVLSKLIDNTSLFWKTAATYDYDDEKVFYIELNQEAIEKTKAAQAHVAFLAAAEHIPFVLVQKPNQKIVIPLLLHSAWDVISDQIISEFSIGEGSETAGAAGGRGEMMTVSRLVLVDSDLDELSPPINNAEKFWKIYLQNYKADLKMSFAAYVAEASSVPSSQRPNGTRTLSATQQRDSPRKVGRSVEGNIHASSPLPPPWVTAAQQEKEVVVAEVPILSTPSQPPPTILKEKLIPEVNETPIDESSNPLEEESSSDDDEDEDDEDEDDEEEDEGEEAEEARDERAREVIAQIEQRIQKLSDPEHPVTPEAQIFLFLETCGNGTLDQVKHLVEVQMMDPNAVNENKSSGMHFACSKGRLEIAKYLFDHGARIDGTNVSGLTPFDCACVSGQIDLCRWLFQSNQIDLNPPEGSTKLPPLSYAALHGKQEIVEWLVNMGANHQARSAHGSTALMDAAHNGHLNIVKFLYRNGASLDSFDSEKVRAIHLAAAGGHLDLVQFLEENGVAIDQPDAFGKTPFLHACSGGHLKVTQWLKEKNVNLLATGGCYDKLNTSLHLAAQVGNLNLVKWLVEVCHLNILARNQKNATAIDFAHAVGHEEVVAYLTNQLHHHHTSQVSDDVVMELENALEVNDIPTSKKLLESILHSPEKINFPYNSTPLHYVAASGLIELAQYLVMLGADVNAVTEVGRTPLHYCTFKEKLEMAKYLQSVGANPRAVDVNGISCLAIARKTQNPNLINWFARFEGDPRLQGLATPPPSSSSSQFSLLSCFSDSTPSSSSQFLLDENLPDVTTSQVIPEYKPPFNPKLHDACTEGNLDEVKYLIGMGLEINRRRDVDELTPLHCAITSGNLELIKYLIEKGAMVNSQTLSSTPHGHGHGHQDMEVMTPLHLACDRMNVEIVLLLIHHGADLHAKNRAGDTPLHIICLLGMSDLLQEIINLPRSLLPNLNLDVRSNHLLNLLHCAADAGSYDTCSLLIHEEIGINSYDDEKKTPLHYACGKGSLDVAKLLISHGAIIDLEDSSKRTPFLYACSSENGELIRYLVDMGAKVTATTNKGNNALHIACKIGNLGLAQWLVAQGVNPDQRNSNSQYPIFFASVNGYQNIVEWLQTQMKTPLAEITQSLAVAMAAPGLPNEVSHGRRHD